MSDTRRELLRNIGIGLTLTAGGAGVVSADAAQHVHHAVAQDKAAAKGAPFKPKAFNAHEYATLTLLASIIVPADEKSKGAVEAGAPEFIDLLCSVNAELKAIYTGGLAWLDAQTRRAHGTAFKDSTAAQRTALLDRIAYRKNASPELNPGIEFFRWARNMVADAFYTSKIGYADLGFMGNSGMAEFQVPAAAISYALKRSGLDQA